MGEGFQKFLDVFRKVKDGVKAEKEVSEAIKTIELPSPSLLPPPISTKIHTHLVKQYQEYEERIMREATIFKVSPGALERIKELIGCPPGIDPVEHLRKRPPPDIPYGVPRWMSAVVGEGQEDQDTTEKKEPTQSLSGPLEAIRESLKKGQD